MMTCGYEDHHCEIGLIVGKRSESPGSSSIIVMGSHVTPSAGLTILCLYNSSDSMLLGRRSFLFFMCISSLLNASFSKR